MAIVDWRRRSAVEAEELRARLESAGLDATLAPPSSEPALRNAALQKASQDAGRDPGGVRRQSVNCRCSIPGNR